MPSFKFYDKELESVVVPLTANFADISSFCSVLNQELARNFRLWTVQKCEDWMCVPIVFLISGSMTTFITICHHNLNTCGYPISLYQELLPTRFNLPCFMSKCTHSSVSITDLRSQLQHSRDISRDLVYKALLMLITLWGFRLLFLLNILPHFLYLLPFLSIGILHYLSWLCDWLHFH